MAKGIKTRETKKDIRALDKAGVAADRMKNSFVRTKDEAMQTQRDGQDYASPTEDAEDKVTDTADRTVHEAAHQAKKQGGKVIDRVKESRRSARQILAGMLRAMLAVRPAMRKRRLTCQRSR